MAGWSNYSKTNHAWRLSSPGALPVERPPSVRRARTQPRGSCRRYLIEMAMLWSNFERWLLTYSWTRAGRFRLMEEGRYRLIEACIAQSVHYLDLADGSEFVAGVRAFDAAARTAGVYVLCGVSSFPVLTAAVVRHLSRDMTRISSIRGWNCTVTLRRRRRERDPGDRRICGATDCTASKRQAPRQAILLLKTCVSRSPLRVEFR